MRMSRTYKSWNLDRDKDVLTLFPPRPGRTLGGTFVVKLRWVSGVNTRNFLNKSLYRGVTWGYMLVMREQCSGDGYYALLKSAF